ncbi:M28 family peptidase [Candidatus Riflebacteria bacterium]
MVSSFTWIIVILLLAGLSFPYFFKLKMPGKCYAGARQPLSTKEEKLKQQLKKHVYKLGEEIGERNLWEYANLEETANYIKDCLTSQGYSVETQVFPIQGKVFKNLEVEIPGAKKPDEIVVIGAHYDSVYGCPAANDNATGVAGILELAGIFLHKKPARTLRFVAFVNEEPPFFQTHNMGSLKYALRCKEREEKVVAMLSLETMGYYSDAAGSQKYPFPLNFFYPNTANFIAFVSDNSSKKLLEFCISSFRNNCKFPSEGAVAPSIIPGISWSDHWSFWKAGYPAVLITDTALFRYAHYHLASDTPDKVDYAALSLVLSGLCPVIEELCNSDEL